MLAVKQFNTAEELLAHNRRIAALRYAPTVRPPAKVHTLMPKGMKGRFVSPSAALPEEAPCAPWYWSSIKKMAKHKRIEAAKHRAADQFGVSMVAIDGPGKTVNLVKARREAIRLACEVFPHWSVSEIGRAFNRDHTTILYHLKALGIVRPKHIPTMEAVWSMWNDRMSIADISKVLDRPSSEIWRALDRARAAHFRGEI